MVIKKYVLDPSSQNLELYSELKIESSMRICKEIAEKVDKPFIWNSSTLSNEWLDISSEIAVLSAYLYFSRAIQDILAKETGKLNIWDIANIACTEDKEWGRERNKNLTGKFYYMFTLKPEYAAKLREIAEEWYRDLEAILASVKANKEKERQEREVRKASLKCEVLKRSKRRHENSWDYSAIVRLTDSGESLEFNCRNIFDVGYVINPNYSVAAGITGGIVSEGKWQTYESGKGWYDVRELTAFEKRCIEYLLEFPPISTCIRM